MGFSVENVAQEGPPLLLATDGKEKAKRTILFYAHYDGQNADPARWTMSAPFEPTLRAADGTVVPNDGGPLEDDWRLYGRAVADDKGPIAVLFHVLQGMRELGISSDDVAIKIVLDGEEESGSPHLARSLSAEINRDKLAADLLIPLDGPVFPTGDPTLYFGVRGITTFDLTVFGASTDLHSGHYGNWAPNAAQEIAWLVTQLKDPFSGKVLVDGFYDQRTPLGPGDLDALEQVPEIDPMIRERFSIPWVEGDRKLREAITWPSLNLRGLSSADVGSGARTVVPARATAAFDIRLVAGCRAETMVDLVEKHLEKLGYRVVHEEPSAEEIAKGGKIVQITRRKTSYGPTRTPIDWDISQELIDVVRKATGEEPIALPTVGGSVPLAVFEEHLSLKMIGLPIVNHDDNQHAPDENVRPFGSSASSDKLIPSRPPAFQFEEVLHAPDAACRAGVIAGHLPIRSRDVVDRRREHAHR
ncbi:MAG: M20/M25/M40 family metallo-hydrolase [Planctomycetota bacterium]